MYLLCLQFFQNTNENNSTWGTIVIRSNFFVRFVEELKIPKRYFEINWPLLCALRPKKMQSRGRKRKYFLFVFWKNWRYQKDISKLIDLHCALWGLKRCNPGERKGSIPLSLVDRPLKRLTGATWYVGPSLYYFSIFWIFFDPPIHYITIIKWVWH